MLHVDHVSKSFGALTAVHDVSFDLGDIGITGLVGPNGSGKSTLFHLISGFYTLDAGRVVFDKRTVSGLAPYQISRLGLMRTFQHTRPLPFLSTMDNLLAAASKQTGERILPLFVRPGRVRREESRLRDKAHRILELIELSHLADELAGRLSYGQQKLMELGRILMADPKLLLLDEPTAGINPTLIRRLVDILGRLCAQGTRIFLIEHNMPLVAELCEQVLVMDSGELIFSGPPAAAQTDARVVEAYLGKANRVA